MTMMGICSLCGKPANSTCPLCGRLVCSQCSNPLNKVCRGCGAKQLKNPRVN